jgi:periplasmic protein TonB
VASESPTGQAFGAAALRIATLYKMKPMLLDGNPVAFGRVALPINFNPP